MRKALRIGALFVVLAAAGLALFYVFVLPGFGKEERALNFAGITGDGQRGKYLVEVAGCVTCHTDDKNKGAYLAGGPPLKTPFGTFFAPNITSDKTVGIGSWSVEDLGRALTAGIAPDGSHYFPAFPYTSYRNLKVQDIADLKAYLDTVGAVPKPSRRHKVSWPFSDRRFVGIWKTLYFAPNDDPAWAHKSGPAAHGAYLVNAVGHCGECHTQRDLLGGKTGPHLGGNTRGPDGTKVPGLRTLTKPDGTHWTVDDIVMSLKVGMTPSGDFLGDEMAKVVEHATSKLTPSDLQAMARYIRSLR